MEENKIYICLENGNVFEGKSFGAKGEVIGELVFTTGMGGYIETLTDPSYFGQIVMQVITDLLRKIRKAKNPLYLRI